MRHGSLFSGIGGFDLAAEWMGWENIFQVEWDSYCQKVLAKNFPNVSRYGDIKEFKGESGSVDILTGGFPCQPFSHAGKRKGESDDRYLWPEYLRVIREIKPTYVVGENVAGLVSMEDGKTLERIFIDLEGEGYQVESFIIPACGVGSWQRRDRIWIVAYYGHSMPQRRSKFTRDNQRGSKERIEEGGESPPSPFHVPDPANSGAEDLYKRRYLADGRQFETEPRVGRMADRVPHRVDRIKGLGNAIVPQVAYEIFKAIEDELQRHIQKR